jgi:hypothetical protein
MKDNLDFSKIIQKIKEIRGLKHDYQLGKELDPPQSAQTISQKKKGTPEAYRLIVHHAIKYGYSLDEVFGLKEAHREAPTCQMVIDILEGLVAVLKTEARGNGLGALRSYMKLIAQTRQEKWPIKPADNGEEIKASMDRIIKLMSREKWEEEDDSEDQNQTSDS